MEALAALVKEAENDRTTIWQYADQPVGEALELVGGARRALTDMYTLLDHIGSVKPTPDSAYGVTPLMSP